jgi:hypothetical protein
LEPALTINGATVFPDLRYKGGDADTTNWDAWTYGEILTYNAGGGAVSVNQGSPLLGANDDSVLFDENAYYTAGNNTLGDITTEDIVVEAVLKLNATGKVAFSKRINDEGWGVYTGINVLSTRIEESAGDGGTAAVISSTGLDVGAWYHLIAFFNRSDATHGAAAYINGVANGTVADLTGISSLTLAQPFCIGAWSNGATGFDSNVAYAVMWKRANWHKAGAAGPAEWAAIAKERFCKLTGFWPQTHKGTAAPVTMTRATIAHTDKLESGIRKLYLVGDHWMRRCHRTDSAGASIRGFLVESNITNLCLQSEDMATTWAKLDAGDSFDLNAIAAPNKATTADGLIADATSGAHGISQAINLTAATYVFSVFAKKGDHDWILLQSVTAGALAYFDLANGAVGTQTDCTGYIEDWGDDWYRCCIVFTGTAAAHTMRILTCDANEDFTVDGDGSTVNNYLWGAQCELAAHGGYMSSYVPTAAGTVARNVEELYYKGDDGNVTNNKKGGFYCKILCEDYDTAGNLYMGTLNDGGAGTDILQFLMDGTGERTWFASAATGANAGQIYGTSDPYDGVVHSVRYTWETNSVTGYFDESAEGTPDTDVGIPDDLDRITVGSNRTTAGQLMGVISEFVLFASPTVRSV